MAPERDERLYLHGYFTVDLEIVWETVETELPSLREHLARLVGAG